MLYFYFLIRKNGLVFKCIILVFDNDFFLMIFIFNVFINEYWLNRIEIIKYVYILIYGLWLNNIVYRKCIKLINDRICN